MGPGWVCGGATEKSYTPCIVRIAGSISFLAITRNDMHFLWINEQLCHPLRNIIY